MSYDIYLCHKCSEPIWFPYGHKEHFGTGWPCWNMPETDVDIPFIDVFVGPEADLELLVNAATDLYQQWRRDFRNVRVLRFLETQLDRNRSDVVRGFLQYLARDEVGEQRERFTSRLVATTAWGNFVTRRTRARRGANAREAAGTSRGAGQRPPRRRRATV